MIQNLNNTTISRFSQILRDERFVCSHWLPKFLLLKYKAKLIADYNTLKNGEAVENSVPNDFYRQSLYYRIMIHQVLLRSLYIEISEAGKELFYEMYGKEYKPEFLSDISDTIERLIIQYNAEMDVSAQPEFDYDEYILSLNRIIGHSIGHEFVYLLPAIEKEALELIKSKEHGTK